MEGNIRVVRCDGWRAFKSETIHSLYHGESFMTRRYLFRGQRRESWRLESSFDRWFRQKYPGVDKADKAALAREFLKRFRSIAAGQPIPEAVWEDEVATLAMAQHHGVLTRLLDWTESPYIAAFFAFAEMVNEVANEENVAIWGLDRAHNIWSGEYGAEILEVTSLGDDRIRSQKGKFTRLKATVDSLDEYINGIDGATGVLAKFLIPASEARMALADLILMGIGYSTIYPGIDGCALSANLSMNIRSTPHR